MSDFNISVFQFFNQFSRSDFISPIATLFADSPIFFLPLFLLYSWISYSYWNKSKESKKSLLFIFYSCVIAIIFSLTIQQFVSIDRPETAITEAWKLLLKHIPDASFPSDHASVSIAFITWLFLTWYRKTFWSFLPFVIIMLISRIIAGVHWPLDIVAGIGVWIFSGYISIKFLSQIKFVKKLNSFIIQALSYIKL